MLTFAYDETTQITTALTDGFGFGAYDHIEKQSCFDNMDGEWHDCADIQEFKRLIMEQCQDNDVWNKDTSPNGKDCDYVESENIPSHRGVQESYDYTIEYSPNLVISA
jgi:hypothetical protein